MNPIKKLWWKTVEFGFRLLYNEMAWTYDWVAWGVSLGQWRNWQRAALPYLGVSAGARVLELAHGTGNLQMDLYAAGYRRVALDLSPAMGRIAQRKLTRHHLEAPLVRGLAQHLPFATHTFDAIVSTFPTPFIIEPATLAEAYRVLKPNKRLIIVPIGVLTSGGVAKQVLETAYQVTGQRGPWPVDIPQRFTDAGFSLDIYTHPCPYSIATVLVATRKN